jgi:hypothetical protein
MEPLPNNPTLNEYARFVHETAVEKGWWIDGAERNFGEVLALMHSELSEALEEYRKGRELNEVYYIHTDPWTGEKSEQETYHAVHISMDKSVDPALTVGKPEGIPVELVDCVIRILDVMHQSQVDLDEVIKTKLDFNTTRPYRHGGKKS